MLQESDIVHRSMALIIVDTSRIVGSSTKSARSCSSIVWVFGCPQDNSLIVHVVYLVQMVLLLCQREYNMRLDMHLQMLQWQLKKFLKNSLIFDEEQ